jgi:hypothetical protein
MFVWQHSTDLAAVYAVGNNKFSLVTFHQKTRVCQADVTVAYMEIYGTRGCKAGKQERFCNAELIYEAVVTSRKDFTVQNCL